MRRCTGPRSQRARRRPRIESYRDGRKGAQRWGPSRQLSRAALRHARPIGRRNGELRLRRRASLAAHASRQGNRRRRRAPHRQRGGETEAQRRLGRAFGLQHGRRSQGRSPAALGPRARLLLCRRPRAPGLALVRRQRCNGEARDGHICASQARSCRRPRRSRAPRHAGDDRRYVASTGLRLGASLGLGTLCRRRRQRRGAVGRPQGWRATRLCASAPHARFTDTSGQPFPCPWAWAGERPIRPRPRSRTTAAVPCRAKSMFPSGTDDDCRVNGQFGGRDARGSHWESKAHLLLLRLTQFDHAAMLRWGRVRATTNSRGDAC